MKKRNMSLILALALILCLVPATALADSTSVPSEVTEPVTISKDTTITGTVNVTGNGKIIVKKGAMLTIDEGATLNLLGSNLTYNDAATTSNRILQIENGAYLNIYGTLKTKFHDFSDILQLGTMWIDKTAVIKLGTGANDPTSASASELCTYFGEGGFVTLSGDNVYIAQVPNDSTDITKGYTYTLFGGTATTHRVNQGGGEVPFKIYGNDEFIIEYGAVLDASDDSNNPTFALDSTSASKTPLTIYTGAKLIADSDVLSAVFGKEGNQKITSGTYTADPTSYIDTENCKVVDNGDGKYTVEPKKGYITNIDIKLAEPSIGKTPASTYTWTVKPEGSATVGETAWFKMSKEKYEDPDTEYDLEKVGENEKFQKDYYYVFATYFALGDGYGASYDKLTVTVNGKEAEDVFVVKIKKGDKYIDAVEVDMTYDPLTETEKAKSPATGDNSELGLFAVAGLISAVGVALLLRRKQSM